MCSEKSPSTDGVPIIRASSNCKAFSIINQLMRARASELHRGAFSGEFKL